MLYKRCVLCIPTGSSVERRSVVVWELQLTCTCEDGRRSSCPAALLTSRTNERDGRPSHLRTPNCRCVLFSFKTTELLNLDSHREPTRRQQSIKPNQSTAGWLTGQLMHRGSTDMGLWELYKMTKGWTVSEMSGRSSPRQSWLLLF